MSPPELGDHLVSSPSTGEKIPQTGAPIKIAARRVVRIRATTGLKDAILGGKR
jgi:nucleoid DNA-binding protein